MSDKPAFPEPTILDTLVGVAGDCDDQVVSWGAALADVGIPVRRLVVVRRADGRVTLSVRVESSGRPGVQGIRRPAP